MIPGVGVKSEVEDNVGRVWPTMLVPGTVIDAGVKPAAPVEPEDVVDGCTDDVSWTSAETHSYMNICIQKSTAKS